MIPEDEFRDRIEACLRDLELIETKPTFYVSIRASGIKHELLFILKKLGYKYDAEKGRLINAEYVEPSVEPAIGYISEYNPPADAPYPYQPADSIITYNIPTWGWGTNNGASSAGNGAVAPTNSTIAQFFWSN